MSNRSTTTLIIILLMMHYSSYVLYDMKKRKKGKSNIHVISSTTEVVALFLTERFMSPRVVKWLTPDLDR